MKILVTGGCGFIGSRLVDKLSLKHEVSVLDNSSSAKNGVKFFRGDVRDTSDVRKAVKGCEAVFHLAAVIDARGMNDDITYAVNFLGSKNVFDAATEAGARVIFASTAAVYGNGPLPNRESSDCNPISQYGKGKLRAEKYLSQKTQDYFVARMFNVYGPNSKSAVNKFCKNITNFKEVGVFGNGLQTRDYVYVTDAVDTLVLGLTNNGVYNVGTGRDVSTLSLIEMIHDMTRCKPAIKYMPPNKSEIVRSRADITKIAQFGWSPKVSLEDGLNSVLDSAGFERH